MEIKSPTASDGGMYKCVVKNEVGEINASLNLNIEGDDEVDGEAPKFMEKPRIVSERDGKLIIMECRVKARPRPTITWTHEGVTVRDGGRVKQTITEEKDNIYVIRQEINNTEIEDAGIYKCNVRNAAGESNANLTLNIEIVPIFSIKPRVIKRESQRKIIIEASVKSSAAPQITWIRESMTVREDSRHQFICREQRKGEYMIQLEIEEPGERDKGVYKVKAKNEKGEVVSEEVRVTGLEEKDEGEEEEKKKKSKKVTAPKIVQELRSQVSLMGKS